MSSIEVGGSTESFFDESREQSIIKGEIVEKYFDAWAGIITGAQTQRQPGADSRIAYIDLFAGPGRYKDGAISTPLRVLQKAIAKPIYTERLVTIFNDKDETNAKTLAEAIAALPGVEKLKHAPKIWNQEVGDQIAKLFASMTTIPVLAFIDPWGYKGLTLQLVRSFLKDWGCDCIFFFNYNRINAGLSNPSVREHMCALFGDERADRLGLELEPLGPAQREATIVNELAVALKQTGARYVLPFCFKNATGKRTTHHLILVTKGFKGYDVMKGIMAKSSSSQDQGVPSFAYSPATDPQQKFLFELNRPLDDLRAMLLDAFAKKTFTMRQIYEQHSVDRPYLKGNYKDVLAQLEKDNVITTLGRTRTRGFADDIVVTFPPKGT
jgi:three-Cys-motif partner protein